MNKMSLEHRQFAGRLCKALNRNNVPILPGTVMKHYNRHAKGYDSVSHYTVEKWLAGTEIPHVGRIRVLANWLAEDVEWLAFGERGDIGYKKLSKDEISLLATYRTLSTFSKRVVRDMLRALENNEVAVSTSDGKQQSNKPKVPNDEITA